MECSTMTFKTLQGSLLGISLIVLAACSPKDQTAGTTASSGTSAGAATAGYTLATGTLVDATLTDTISSRHAHAGDAFTANVVTDVRSAGGRVAIPAGSTVHGTIAKVSPAPNNRSTGTLTLAVTSVTVRGTTYDINASIDSLVTVRQGRGVEAVDVARVAGGAAAGAILGRVIGGDAAGAIVGGVAGGAAGVAVSAAMADVDIVLPAGSHLMLTLTHALTVKAD